MADITRFTKRHGGHETMDTTMAMDMSGDSGSSSMSVLSPDNVDFSNRTQALEFLEDILDDTFLKINGDNFARYFWYGVVVVVAITMLFKLLRWLTLQQRLREAARRRQSPAKPSSWPAKWLATITAMGREVTYLQFTPTTRFLFFKVPPVGTIILVLGYLAFVLALEFANNGVDGAQYWQSLGVRAGWLTVAQMPLLILLINKNSVLGTLTGTSWERLNVIHRWSARIMLLLAIFHFAFQSTGWQKYGVMTLEWET